MIRSHVFVCSGLRYAGIFNVDRTSGIQTREKETLREIKTCQQKEKKEKIPSSADRNVIGIEQATRKQKCYTTRTVVKISKRAPGNKPKNNGAELHMACITTAGLKKILPGDF